MARTLCGQTMSPVPSDCSRRSAETIPLASHSMDTIVAASTMCSIPDVGRALSEVRRVLKPSGRLLFVEHGRAPDVRVAAWQDRLTPLWRQVAGGCHLNRAVAPTRSSRPGFASSDWMPGT